MDKKEAKVHAFAFCVCACIYIYMYVYIYTYIYIYIYIYMYVHTHTHTHTHTHKSRIDTSALDKRVEHYFATARLTSFCFEYSGPSSAQRRAWAWCTRYMCASKCTVCVFARTVFHTAHIAHFRVLVLACYNNMHTAQTQFFSFDAHGPHSS